MPCIILLFLVAREMILITLFFFLAMHEEIPMEICCLGRDSIRNIYIRVSEN